jgi:hypothetical protein
MSATPTFEHHALEDASRQIRLLYIDRTNASVEYTLENADISDVNDQFYALSYA